MKRPALDVLADLAREDAETRSDDDAWVRRAAGEASESEEASLAARASSDEEAAFLLEMTRPLSDEKMDALVALSTKAAARAPASHAEAAPAKPAPLRGARLQAALRWGVPALVAAAGLLFLVRPQGGDSIRLPEYSVTVEGADARFRGAPADPQPTARREVSAGARLALTLRPAEAVSTPVAAVAYMRDATGVRLVPVPLRVAPSGTATLEGTREELFGDRRGSLDLTIFIGPPGALPAGAAAVDGELAKSVRRIELPFELK
jgi:hypothetical protein